MFTHFSPKTTIFGLLRGHFWPKTWKIKCFQFIQSKISQFVTQMWLPKKLQFLVPGTPPEPPIPPLTPPRGPGGPKMAKMYFLSPMMIVNAKKAISGGSKMSTYFFTWNVPDFTAVTATTFGVPSLILLIWIWLESVLNWGWAGASLYFTFPCHWSSSKSRF